MKDDGLIAKVTREISNSPNGRGTINDLEKVFPDVPRTALLKALQNAAYNGFIHLLMPPQAQGYGKGTLPGVWGPVPEWERERRKKLEAEKNRPEPYKPKTVWMHVPPHPQEPDVETTMRESQCAS